MGQRDAVVFKCSVTVCFVRAKTHWECVALGWVSSGVAGSLGRKKVTENGLAGEGGIRTMV